MDTVNFILSLVFDQLMSPVWLVFGFITAHLNLALLSILTGVGFSLPQIYGLKNPKGFADAARSLSESKSIGACDSGLGLFTSDNRDLVHDYTLAVSGFP